MKTYTIDFEKSNCSCKALVCLRYTAWAMERQRFLLDDTEIVTDSPKTILQL